MNPVFTHLEMYFHYYSIIDLLSFSLSFLEGASEEELRLRITLSPTSKEENVGLAAGGKTGLRHPAAMFLMTLWYLFSALNLFANKYIISYLRGDPALLGNLEDFYDSFFLFFRKIKYFFLHIFLSYEPNVYVHVTWLYPATLFLWSFCQSPSVHEHMVIISKT